MSEKIYSAEEAARAVLGKVREILNESGLLKAEKHEHIGWGKLHGKLEKEGYSKDSADKIAGSIKAKVEKSEPLKKDLDAGVGAQISAGFNGATAGGTPPPVQKNDETSSSEKGHVKLAKFMGRMAHKRSSKAPEQKLPG